MKTNSNLLVTHDFFSKIKNQGLWPIYLTFSELFLAITYLVLPILSSGPPSAKQSLLASFLPSSLSLRILLASSQFSMHKTCHVKPIKKLFPCLFFHLNPYISSLLSALFHQQSPALWNIPSTPLHHLTTIIHPSILSSVLSSLWISPPTAV